MKIQAYIYLVTAVLFCLVSCDQNGEIPKEYDRAALDGAGIRSVNASFFKDEGSVLRGVVDPQKLVENDVILSEKNEGAIMVGKSDLSQLKTDTIIIDIVLDDAISDWVIREDWINAVLRRLNTGLQVKLSTPSTFPLSSVNTDGRINTDKLVADLNPQRKYTAYLFETASFFNTANAIAIRINEREDKNSPSPERVLLMGNAYLLQSPFLFVHELLHGMGLTHHNEMYVLGPCNHTASEHQTHLFNVMNESNVGCARRLSARQIMILNEQEYFPPVVNDPLYGSDDACGCDFSGLGNAIEHYLNGFDMNIDDTPLVGDNQKLLDYLITIRDTILPSKIEKVVSKNFDNEFSELGLDETDRDAYTTLRIETLKLQRHYNLARWIKDNAELQGIPVEDSLYWPMSGYQLPVLDTLAQRALAEWKGTCASGCEVSLGGIALCDLLDPKDGAEVSGRRALEEIKKALTISDNISTVKDGIKRKMTRKGGDEEAGMGDIGSSGDSDAQSEPAKEVGSSSKDAAQKKKKK